MGDRLETVYPATLIADCGITALPREGRGTGVEDHTTAGQMATTMAATTSR